MSLRSTLDFLLYDWLDAESLNQRERFADHSRETFDAVLDTCERIAREKYAPFNRTVDTQEPHFDGEKVILPQAIPPVIPMLGNYLIVLFKETPLLSAILVVEMLQTAKIIGSETWRYLEPITIVGLLFLLLSYPASLLVQHVEKKVNRSRGRQQTNKGVSA